MARVMGIVDLHNEPSLGELTATRPLGTVTFLGRYGLIDFALSNLSNSGINIIPILVDKGIGFIRSHIRDGNIWVNNTKIGFIRLIMNEKMVNNPTFNTDVNNIIENKGIFDGIDFDYVIVTNSHYLYSFDFNYLIRAIEHNNADIMMLYSSRTDADQDFLDSYSLKLDGNRIVDVKRNNGINKFADISLGTYIFKTKVLHQMIQNSHEISALYTLRDLVNYAIRNKTYNVQGYKFDGYVVPVLSLETYVKQSLKLLDYETRKKLFLPNWPIYTTSHNTPPALYLENAEVKNSFIANGSVINGKVENSILSRDVVIEKGAEVKNCIIFTHTRIGEKVKLSYVISDKRVTVKETKVLKGSKEGFIAIPQGAKL